MGTAQALSHHWVSHQLVMLLLSYTTLPGGGHSGNALLTRSSQRSLATGYVQGAFQIKLKGRLQKGSLSNKAQKG